MVTDTDAVPALESFTLAGFRLHAGMFCALVGELVSAQVRFIVPAYVPAVRLSMDVPVAPAEMDAGEDAVAITGETVTVVVAFLAA